MSNSDINPSTLVDLVCQRSQSQPHQKLYTFLLDGETDERHLTYQELEQQAQGIAATLQNIMPPGARALLLYPPGLDYICAFFGCLYAGVIAVPAYPPDPTRLERTLPRLQAIAQDAQATVALTTSPILAMAEFLLAQAPDFPRLEWLATDTGLRDSAEWQAPSINRDTVAFLQYTSGSTAAPKGVMLTHDSLLRNSALIYDCFGHSPHSQGVIWLPPYHDMGLIGGIIQPLYGGFPVTLLSPIDFLKRPSRWLQAVSRYQATTSGGPNFAYDLCVRKIPPQERAALDLSSWDLAFNGAEPIRRDTIERFAAAFAPCGFRKEAFYPCYGLAEATLIVSGGLKTASPVFQSLDSIALGQNRVQSVPNTHENALSVVGCGHALNDQHIVIADPDTRCRCAADQIGEIWVAGPSVAQGYWSQPQATTETFQAYLADSGAGPYLRTGDLGFLQDGELFITGRLKDLIIIRGRNHYPQDIEQTVEQSHPALRPGCGAAFAVELDGQEQLIVVQEVRQTADLDPEPVIGVIRQAVAEQHELQAHSVLLLRPRSIPKTSSGKIQRHACRAGFLSGDLDTVAESAVDTSASATPAEQPEESFIRKALAAVEEPAARHALLTLYLQEQVARVLRRSPTQIAAEQPLNTLGLDSLMVIELQHSLETSLGLISSMTDFIQGRSVSQLVAHVLAELRASSAAPPTRPAPAQDEEIEQHPLSRGQRAMWFLQQLAPGSAAYNIASAVRMRGELDVPALRRVFQQLVDRHPSLRTTFPAPQGEPVQHVHERAEVCFRVEEASTWRETSLNERLAEGAHQPFDLGQGPLLRVHLFRRSAQEHVLLLVVHHIVADFWSLAVLVHELGALYPAEQAGAPASLPLLTLQYADFARRQVDALAGPGGERLWAYWKEQLSGALPVLNLPTDRPRPAVQTRHGASQALKLSSELTQQLEALSRAQGVTLYTTLLAAFQALLHRYTGQQDILVGSPVAGRERAELAGLVGYFVNPLVMRASLSGAEPFTALLAQVRQTVLAAFAHQGYPFDLLVERLRPERDPSQSPIFQTMFIFQQTPLFGPPGLASFALGETGARMELGGVSLESVALEQRAAQLDLTLVVAERAGGLAVSLLYNSDLFEAATMRRMLEHWQVLLQGVVTHPEQRLFDLPLLSEVERQQMLGAWNATQAEYAQDQGLHELFEAQVARTPERVATVFEDQHLTYRELNRRANQLAHYLQTLGVEPETRVGLYLERSLEMVWGLLGTLKAGGTYVPLDPDYPQERIALVLEDAQAPVLLTHKKLLQSLPGNGARTICLDADEASIAPHSGADPSPPLSAENLAYVIYTSGSTGRPKGVQISHRGLVNFVNATRQRPGLTERDVLLAVTTLSFDIAGLELFLPLTSAARVVVVSREVAADGPRLRAQLADSGATIIQATPATWRLLLETGWPGDEGLKILCGGEAFPRELANQLLEKCASLWNMYGPTETTIWSAIYPLLAGNGPVPIGRPIDNTQLYVLDGRLQPVPTGVVGQLYIGGDGLARGYFNRPALTAEKFIPNPFAPPPTSPPHGGGMPAGQGGAGTRLYHTGDLARYLADGNVEFLGRTDHQVKLRGFRIELGDIEAALGQHPAVQETVVLAREDPPGGKRLVAYVVPGDGQEPTTSELRRFLRQKLPDYMIPSVFVTLDALPLTPNGKVNRRALPAPAGIRPELETTYAAPRSKLEQAIAQVWQEVLQVDQAGLHDNFFDLGGHSLLMARVHHRLQQVLERDLSMVEMFQYATIHSLARYLSQTADEQPLLQQSQERVEIRGARRATLLQQRQRRRKSRVTNG